ncbi:TonB-dependent receptor plug domain-containing protein, partial [Bacteroides coprosuis]
KAYYHGVYTSDDIDVNWQFGFSDQQYGANTFYSAKYNNQYEKTRRYITSVQAQTKGWFVLTPTLYWNRSHDNFQLIKDSPKGENFHMTDVYGANLNAHFTTVLGKTAFGAEVRNEGILSTNLGKLLEEDQKVKVPGEKDKYFDKKDNRTNVSYYLEHNILLQNFTASFGVMANMNTALDHKYRFYPGIDLSYRPSIHWKAFVSWNKALRMPTFTDLYYKSPTQEGNIGLKPEETQAYTLGLQYQNNVIKTELSGFYHKGKQMIDWVMYDAEDVYHSANFKLDNRGFETNTVINTEAWLGKSSWIKQIQVGYSYISQKRKDNTPIYKSNYALNYLKHKFVANLRHKLFTEKLTLNWAFRWQDRMGDYIDFGNTNHPEGILTSYPSFALLDLKVQWTESKYTIFAEANNLLDRTYFDLGNIPQPGFWFKTGIKCKFYL